MHVSQFQAGDRVRHSSYARGEFATVTENDTTSALYESDDDAGNVVRHVIVDGTVRIERAGSEQVIDASMPEWADAEWAHADAKWTGEPEAAEPDGSA